jgi:uncharacterized membrane protein YfcA
MDPLSLAVQLGTLAFGAAVLNGMIGYGFSSTVTPIALFWLTNRMLNPALIVVELGVNGTLLVRERRHIRATWPRVRYAIVGLFPGVILGALLLATLAPNIVKVAVYAMLLPLVALQLLGVRRRLARETASSTAVGAGVGFIFSLTTISGPPLALYWRNQGLTTDEFRCAMAQVRVAESSTAIAVYAALGLFTPAALELIPNLLIPVIIGIPLGIYLIRWANGNAFGYLVMGADGLFVSYGLSNVLNQLRWVTGAENAALLLLLVALSLALTARSLLRLPSVRGGPADSPLESAGGASLLDSASGGDEGGR